jgi:hypothetical protein
MSAVIATPELMAQAATDLSAIGSTVNAAHMTTAPPTLSVLPAAADEVSAGIAHLFSVHAQDYRALAGKAAAFQDQFVQHLSASAVFYASAEAANVALLQPLTAIADLWNNAIAALPGQLINLFLFAEQDPVLYWLVVAPIELILLAPILLFLVILRQSGQLPPGFFF